MNKFRLKCFNRIQSKRFPKAFRMIEWNESDFHGSKQNWNINRNVCSAVCELCLEKYFLLRDIINIFLFRNLVVVI